ncbi:MAG: metal ABC transporter permease [Gammaproteobacteria bacterium]|nr:metal ABC transporter permease [Gammaproteobacteria bacterium]
MTELFSALIDYSFMQHAFIACILSSIGCGIIGTYVVVKRVGFLAGGIAHTVLAGMGIAYFMESSPLIGAVIAALIAAVSMSFIKLRWKQQEDILVAAFWSVGMAIGILFISRTPGYSVDLMSFLFGNILLVSKSDLLLMAILDIIIIGIVFLFYKQFMAAVFDEEFARIRGIRIEIYYTLLMCMVALTVVLLIQIVGLILVIALLIFPAACAAQFFHSIFKMMLAATVICMLMTISGLTIAYQPDLPAGATIIVIAGVFYAISIVCSSLLRQLQKRSAAN